MIEKINNIKLLIGSGETKAALDMLVQVLQNTKSNYLDTAILIQGRFSELEKKSKIEYSITQQEADIFRNQINHASLSLLDSITQKYDMEDRIHKYAIQNKVNKLIYVVLLVPFFLLCWQLKIIYGQIKIYQNELVKKEEYIKTLEFKSQTITYMANDIKSNFPEIDNFINEYNQLHILHLDAIRNGNLNLKSEIVNKIHQLPSKYGLDKPNRFTKEQASKVQEIKTHMTNINGSGNGNIKISGDGNKISQLPK